MNKKGFTLVELLAVIVILAVILVIAVPQISDAIKNSKIASIENSLRLIIGEAETKYETNKMLGESTSNITCDSVSNLSDRDYENCRISYDASGNATVSLNGKIGGKFENISCSGTKNNITCQEGIEENATDAACFTTLVVPSKYDINYDLCILEATGGRGESAATEENKALCRGEILENGMSMDITIFTQWQMTASSGETVKEMLENSGLIENIEYNGVMITAYDSSCPKDIVIPQKIDNKTVLFLDMMSFASLGINSVSIPNGVIGMSSGAFNDNNITKITIPDSVYLLLIGAFANNQINEINFPTTPISIYSDTFLNNPITENEYVYPSNVFINN